MTFILKGKSQLADNQTEGFQNAIKVYLKSNDKTVDTIPEPRKAEIKLLQAVTKAIENDKSLDAKQTSKILYGIMFLIQKDMNFSGSLCKSLNIAMGTTTEKPNPQQILECHQAANEFLNRIYIEKDVSRGFQKTHMLDGIDKKRLDSILKLSQQLECEASINATNATKALGNLGKEANGNAFRFVKPLEENIDTKLLKEKFTDWPKLKEVLGESINQEVSARSSGEKNISGLQPQRAFQASFLVKVQNALKPEEKIKYHALSDDEKKALKLKDEEKKAFEYTNAEKIALELSDEERMALLVGVMYIVRGQIAMVDYKKPPLHKEKTTSVLHTELNKYLADKISKKQIMTFVTNAVAYLQQALMETAPEEVSKLLENHSFSQVLHIDTKDYFNGLFNTAATIVRDCFVEELEHAIRTQIPTNSATNANAFLAEKSTTTSTTTTSTSTSEVAAAPKQ